MNQTIGFGGSVEIFSNSDFQRTSLFVEYQFRNKWVPLSVRINYANRFSINDAQLELDVYPKINDKIYLFGNLGFSNNQLFPSFRLAFEPYFLLPKKFELSVGYRHINFITSTSNIYTASINKYIGNIWFGLRTYFSVNNFGSDVIGNKTTQIYEGAFKYFFSNRYHFIEARFGAGNNPDDAYLYSNFQEVRFFESRFISLGYSHFFNDRWFWRLNYVYNLQLPDTRANFTINSVSLSIWYLF
jgi:YaiO family outer membrane protein